MRLKRTCVISNTNFSDSQGVQAQRPTLLPALLLSRALTPSPGILLRLLTIKAGWAPEPLGNGAEGLGFKVLGFRVS